MSSWLLTELTRSGISERSMILWITGWLGILNPSVFLLFFKNEGALLPDCMIKVNGPGKFLLRIRNTGVGNWIKYSDAWLKSLQTILIKASFGSIFLSAQILSKAFFWSEMQQKA